MKKSISFIIGTALLWNSCAKDGTEKRCDKGFTGRNCDQEITPSKMQVTRIEVTTLPAFDTDGSNWDPLGGKPDVYMRIIDKSSNTVVYESATLYNYNYNGGIYSNLSNSNVLLNHPTTRYNVEAWDHDDADPDDYMGSIEFTPYIKGEKFPPQVTMSCQGCNTAWKLDYTYLY